ncbi:uncharacterized protein LOC122072607 [Macadamia integrifolia]|uniref:uncharacterized protein LOC122072607 n=1 Tax=Macadamia integrifolia TaxID=60698 RepID=UPI001C4F6423|nr:uncharacterized protein LOC122072607 [Macadamia integrifolia]
MAVEGENPCADGSEANRSVEVGETFKGTVDGVALVGAGVPKEENFGTQMEEGMDKVCLVGSSESSFQISVKSENIELGEQPGSGGCLAIVQSVKEETEVDANGEKGFKVSSDTNLEKSEENFGTEVEREMEKVSSVGASESSVQIYIKRENMSELDEQVSANRSVEVGDTVKGIPFVEAGVPGEVENFGTQIEEGIEKVSLVGALESSVQISVESENMLEFDEQCLVVVQSVTEETEVDVNGEMGFKVTPDNNLEKLEENSGRSNSKSGELSDGDENDSSSESESEVSSSSSSSSSCSEEEEEEEEEEDDETDMEDGGEMEEGEISGFEGDGIAGDSDIEEDEVVMGGPIKSKSELQILPPVPLVDVALEPHHETLPVGVISSIMGTKVIVEGLEKHNPLNEGSILWITETRLPLGLVDEIFGPVKNPYYVVRYNSGKEVPAGIHNGTPVSFVEDFADHVINDKNLYKKGYDASGENDEEVSDEFEFSDDEKEAEYRRMVRMAKRGSDDRKRGNRDFVDRKKALQKGEFRKKIHLPGPPGPQPPSRGGLPPGIQNQCHTPSVASPVGCGGFPYSHGTGPGTASMSTFVPSVSQQGQASYCMPQHLLALNNGVWTNGMQSQQQQHAVFPNGFPNNGLPSQQQNVPLPCGQPFQHPHPLFVNLPNGMPVQQQFDPSQQQFVPSQMLLPSMVLPYGQPNFTARPLSVPWTGNVGHPGLSQATFGMDFASQSLHPCMNSGQQGVTSSGSCNEQSYGMQPPGVAQESFAAPQQFHQGVYSAPGRKPYQRGRGNFEGGRGRRQSG